MNVQTPNTLRYVLFGNAIFCGLGGLVCASGPGVISAILGLDIAPVILILGISLIGYAGFIYFMASRPVILRQFVLFAICIDSAWVLGSILLLLTGWLPLSVAGKWSVGILAVIVDLFASLQFMEWRKM
jgi:hypothetical protein